MSMDVGIVSYKKDYYDQIGKRLEQAGIKRTFSFRPIQKRGEKMYYQLTLPPYVGKTLGISPKITGKHPFQVISKLKSVLTSLIS